MTNTAVPDLQDAAAERRSFYAKVSVYVAISILAAGGALIVAFILTGAAGDVIGRSFLTLILLAGFAFAVVGETYASEKRYGWVTLTHIAVLVVTLIAGLWHVWSPKNLDGIGSNYYLDGSEFVLRTFLFIVTAGALQLVSLGYSILGWRIKAQRITSGFLAVLTIGISVFSVAVVMLTVGFTFPNVFFELPDYWRWFAALFVTAVVMILIPLLARSLEPKKVVSAVTVPGVQSLPAGWYATQNPAVEQFWDGLRWTEYTRPAGIDDEEPPLAKEGN